MAMPIVSKTLSQTDAKERLSIPTKRFTKYLFSLFEGTTHKIVLLVKDLNGDVWPIRCSIRKRGHYLKPVLYWRNFAVAKGLERGNKVNIYMETDPASEAHFKIEVKKTIRLLGNNIEGMC